MKFARKALPALALFFMVAIPNVSFAAATFFGPIIDEACQCKDSAPDFGCVLQTIQNTMNLGISLSVIIVTFVIAYAGFMYIMSPISAENRQKAKTAITNAVIGIVLVLGAWLIVDFIMGALYSKQWGPWNEIIQGSGPGSMCIIPKEGSGILGGGGGGVSVTPGGGTASCADCVSLSPPLTCKSSKSCTLDKSVAAKFKAINSSVPWRVTEAFPPTVTHKASCQNNGTCIDAGFTNSSDYTGAKIKAFSQAASAQGLCVVFETDSNSLYEAARGQGIVAHRKSESAYSHITGSHFSVYSRLSDCH